MRDAIEMWKEPRLVVLTAVCAAVYAAAMIPFKVLVIFPGLAEVRPAAALPVVFSFLFGPAGAFGAGFGNVVGDMLGGMLGPGSLFGFAANFAYGYVPYKLWQALMGGREVTDELKAWQERTPAWVRRPRTVALVLALVFTALFATAAGLQLAGAFNVSGLASWKWGGKEIALGTAGSSLFFAAAGTLAAASIALLAYSPLKIMAVIFVACLCCAGVLGWGIEMLGFFPFRVFGTWILGNNFILCALLAPPLLLILHPRVAARSMLYSDLLARPAGDGSIRINIARSRAGAVVVIMSSVALFVLGVLVSQEQFALWFGSQWLILKDLAYTPLVFILFIGLALL